MVHSWTAVREKRGNKDLTSYPMSLTKGRLLNYREIVEVRGRLHSTFRERCHVQKMVPNAIWVADGIKIYAVPAMSPGL